ncbi:MAG: L,D-transpeptidase [Nanoarchaeota archaeon]|nr:L,D-transpeptidase [Nanoarchaeota archaeon]
MDRREFTKSISVGLFGALFFPHLLNPFSENNVESKLEEKLHQLYQEIENKFGVQSGDALILDGPSQMIYLANNNFGFKISKNYSVSTSKNGFGNKINSSKTPTGIHKVSNMYGESAPCGTVFVSKRETKRKAKIYAGEYNPTKLITSRVIEISGCEEKNKDTFRRMVYLHGTSAEGLIGKPVSGGCIRMKNNNIIELYNLIKKGTYLNISED